MMPLSFMTPPMAFLAILSATILLALLLSRCAFRNDRPAPGAKKPYACGEDLAQQQIQPDYSQFFPFAFFFTMLHVVALVIATVPLETVESFAMAVIYVAGAVVGLLILLKK
jgi:NADH-quinone oxidoreductase subunit A